MSTLIRAKTLFRRGTRPATRGNASYLTHASASSSLLIRRPFNQSHRLAPPSRVTQRGASTFFTGLGKMAGRTAGRGVIGLGIGASVLSYAEYKIEGIKRTTADWAESVSQATQTLSAGAAGVAGTLRDSLTAFFSAREDGSEDSAEKNSSDSSEKDTDDHNTNNDEKNKNNRKPKATAAAAATAAATSTALPSDSADSSDEGLMLLTRSLIEIRSILLSLGDSANLTLPSIVVIGSQSSGKSSVLEAIVGAEFLPKGANMVTRRPIELTLVHTPPTPGSDAPPTYAEFPALGPGRITDFDIVRRTLTDLNLAVSAEQCVSDEPIHLRVYSPHVPDLSLIDLPGYVQIASMDQPEHLKQKIAALCEKYIQAPNIILAVCPADVDLANSPALRASRRVDPLGLRTLGVVTKMDLVTPDEGVAILTNDKYPLSLGYVGVVCGAPRGYTPRAIEGSQTRGLLSWGRGSAGELAGQVSGQLSGQLAARAYEADYFATPAYAMVPTGTDTLKRRLMSVLEESMGASLHSLSNAVAREVEEARYQFKVQYNDRRATPEAYVAETLDYFKQRVGELQAAFSKAEVRRVLSQALSEQCMDLLAQFYWGDEGLSGLGDVTNGGAKAGGNAGTEPAASSWFFSASPPSNAPPEIDAYWSRKLDLAAAALTKSGVGRASTQLVVDLIRARLAEVFGAEEPLVHHHDAAARILATADAILRERFALTADQVENAVKPLKYEVEIEGSEWEVGRERAVEQTKRELQMCEHALRGIRDVVGGRRLRGVMEYVGEAEERRRRSDPRAGDASSPGAYSAEYAAPPPDDLNSPAYPPALLARAREAMFLSTRSSALQLRLLALKSRRCKKGPSEKIACPEVFLDVLANKLAQSAVQFINIELLVEFFYQFPREIDNRLSYALDREQLLAFANENPHVRAHLQLQDRKEKLELVASKLDSLLKLQAASPRYARGAVKEKRGGLFGVF